MVYGRSAKLSCYPAIQLLQCAVDYYVQYITISAKRKLATVSNSKRTYCIIFAYLDNAGNFSLRQNLRKHRNQSWEWHPRRRGPQRFPNIYIPYKIKHTQSLRITSGIGDKTSKGKHHNKKLRHQTFQGRKRETQNIFRQNMSVDPVTPNNILLGSQKIIHPRIILFRTRTALIRATWHHLRLPQDNATQQQVPHAVTVHTGALHTASHTRKNIAIFRNLQNSQTHNNEIK